DGSLLDHSMILFGSGISNSDRHTHGPLPTLLAGGGAGTLKGGRHLVYPEHTPLTNLQLTLLNKLGLPAEKLGDSNGQFKELSECNESDGLLHVHSPPQLIKEVEQACALVLLLRRFRRSHRLDHYHPFSIGGQIPGRTAADFVDPYARLLTHEGVTLNRV